MFFSDFWLVLLLTANDVVHFHPKQIENLLEFCHCRGISFKCQHGSHLFEPGWDEDGEIRYGKDIGGCGIIGGSRRTKRYHWFCIVWNRVCCTFFLYEMQRMDVMYAK